MTIAIIKPDHIGDLVLSSPAIRAVHKSYPDVVLFVSTGNVPLANYLFPEIAIDTIDVPQISKTALTKPRIPDLRSFDVVLILRRDSYFTLEWAKLRTQSFILPEDSHEDHQSLIDYSVVRYLIDHYDIDDMFYRGKIDNVCEKALAAPTTVGLSIGSGFHANAWPFMRWVETALMLRRSGLEVSIVCGPREVGLAKIILDMVGLDEKRGLIVGTSDFQGLIEQLDRLDLVIASDGGTAHLCSLVTPILSLFGPSPLKRYAPFGRWNRLLTLGLPCSPCCQWTSHLVNGCLTIECMVDIDSLDVAYAMDYRISERQMPLVESWDRRRKFYVGVSHLDRDTKIGSIEEQFQAPSRIRRGSV